MMESCDVAVIGAGTAGIAAALRARELGASVVALERGQEIGGACGIRLSGGAFHLAMGSMDLDPDAMLAHINKVTGGEIAPNLARMVADNSKPSIEWLATQGVPFKPQGGEHGKFTIDPRGHRGRAGNSIRRPPRISRCVTCTSGLSSGAGASTTAQGRRRCNGPATARPGSWKPRRHCRMGL